MLDKTFDVLSMLAPEIVVPEVNSGSLNATPTGLVLGMFYPLKKTGTEVPI
jgi:hypothetical protein